MNSETSLLNFLYLSTAGHFFYTPPPKAVSCPAISSALSTSRSEALASQTLNSTKYRIRPFTTFVLLGLFKIYAYAGHPYDGEALESYSEELLQKAESGDAKAQFNLGLCYDVGMGTLPNHDEAFKWYKKSAEQGNAFGEMNLGRCYDLGIGTGRNYREAVKWFKKSADQGNVMGMSYLSAYYDSGTGVDQDYREALKWSTKAEAKGDTSASQLIDWQKKGIRVQEENLRAMSYVKADDFTFVDAVNSDGDTIFIRDPNGIIISCQLLGVDAFEVDNVIEEQLAEQARHFGITNEQAIELGRKAKAFCEKLLRGADGKQKISMVSMPIIREPENYGRLGGKDGPFDPYSNVFVDGDIVVDNESLSCLLVKNGLARIREVVPSAEPFLVSREKLEQLEAEAKKTGVGGWGMTKKEGGGGH